jgi:hypothetical protein
MDYLGDGYCDIYGDPAWLSMSCEEFDFDGGDCWSGPPADDAVTGDYCEMPWLADGLVDCAGDCTPAAWIGDGECNSSLDCEATDYDGGDCAECIDTDAGAADFYGDTCAEYYDSDWWCGGYDTADFDSMSMCCACGGGE